MSGQKNKFLSFKLDDENYALPILKVKEIIGMMKITKVPSLPNYVMGVINLRGQIIPVIDLRLKFELKQREHDDRTSIIVVEQEREGVKMTSGIIVDTVKEVLDIEDSNIEVSPENNMKTEQSFFEGLGKVDETVVMLIDIDRILDTDKLEKHTA